MSNPPLSPALQSIQREELSRLIGNVFVARLVAVPVFLGVLIWALVGDFVPWRRAILLVAMPVAAAFIVMEWLRARRSAPGPGSIAPNLAAGLLMLGVMAAASGGIESPLTFIGPLLLLMAGLLVPRPASLLLALSWLAIVWGLAAIALAGVLPDFSPELFGGGTRAGHNDAHLLLTASFLTLATGVVLVIGARLRRGFESMIARTLLAQGESLRAHAERVQELTALSGEIAHELKNPLASVKGLAGLLAQSAGDAKSAERLGVLRREVERMQWVLDDFLNFSRPLVPLTLERIDLGPLCWEVAALHEGLAREQGVSLTVAAPRVEARCDPRKIKQVLINVVQNAIEASSAGGEVAISLGDRAGAATVEVLDRGAGPPAGLGERVFEPGITTKERGSGLGLTIARALARQHGGDLELAPREGGGSVARLRLPAAGPSATVGTA